MKRSAIKFSVITGLFVLILAMPGCELNNNHGQENPELTRQDSLCIQILNHINPDSISSKINDLAGMGTRFALAPNHRNVAFRIRDMFRNAGYENASVDSFQTDINWKGHNYTTWQYNISAELVGTIHPDSVNVVGAHYDSMSDDGDPFVTAPGANDNGSGVAAVLEIARILKTINYRPSISIRFVAFGAEEIGLLGSADFAEKLALSGRPVGIVLNNDMIANVSTPNYQLWAVKIIYYGNTQMLATGTSSLCTKYIGLYPQTDTTYNKRYDSYSFFRENFRALGFSSVEISNTYHSVNDNPLDCNLTYCSAITGLSCVLLVYHD